jgi:16S rRNA (guanine527-N7)-methyltransferase
MLGRMDASRIRELLAPFSVGLELTDVHVTQLSTYLDLLLKWNSRMNLTSVREPEQIVSRHFGDSLFAASLVASASPRAKSLMDVGSGAGFPGIPIKIAMPPLQLTLIEAQQKKATFLREVVRALNLSDAQVANTRADQFGRTADLVTLRAVESFEQILPVAERLVAAQGTMVLLIGTAQAEKAKSLIPGFKWKEAHAIPLSERRVVLLGSRH